MQIVNHPVYGPSLPEAGWVPAPRYLLRRHIILKHLQALQRGRLLEIGCGAGTLLYEAHQLGFQVEGMEASISALEIARQVNPLTKIYASPQDGWHEAFDYVCAYEVLEHIENDEQAIAEWRSWIKPSGKLLLSVPAHMKKWSQSDVWAGHYRRYEKNQLLSLIKSCGFDIETIECYGFPLYNIISIFSNHIHAKELKKRGDESNRKTNNDLSGVSRKTESRLYPILKSPVGRMSIWLGTTLQSLTLKKDWGDGYFIMATRR